MRLCFVVQHGTANGWPWLFGSQNTGSGVCEVFSHRSEVGSEKPWCFHSSTVWSFEKLLLLFIELAIAAQLSSKVWQIMAHGFYNLRLKYDPYFYSSSKHVPHLLESSITVRPECKFNFREWWASSTPPVFNHNTSVVHWNAVFVMPNKNMSLFLLQAAFNPSTTF